MGLPTNQAPTAPRPGAVAQTPSPVVDHEKLAARRRITAAVACVAAFMVFVDVTIVSVALPAMARSLRSVGRSEVSLTLTVYATSLAALMLPGGRLADYVGRRRLFNFGLAGFAASSLLCGISTSLTLLLVARALQGACAALMAPASLALLFAEFPPSRHFYALGIWSSAAGLAAAFGPGLGGLLVTLIGWRSVFLVNVPIGIMGVLISRRWVQETRGADAPKPDPLVIAPCILAAVALTSALFEVARSGSLNATASALIAVAFLCSGLCWRRGRRTSRPLLAGVHDGGAVAWAAGSAIFLTSAAGYALLYANVFFLQSIWHYSALRQGLAVTPAPVITALVVVPASRLAGKLGPLTVAVPGTILLAAGAIWFHAEAGPTSNWIGSWLPGAVLTGTGIGLSFPTTAAAAIVGSNPGSLGTTIAWTGTLRQVGAVAGISAVALISGVHPGVDNLVAIDGGWLLVAGLSLASAVALIPFITSSRRQIVPA